MLYSIIFTIKLGIGTFFVYYKCKNLNFETGVKYDLNYQTTI